MFLTRLELSWDRPGVSSPLSTHRGAHLRGNGSLWALCLVAFKRCFPCWSELGTGGRSQEKSAQKKAGGGSWLEAPQIYGWCVGQARIKDRMRLWSKKKGLWWIRLSLFGKWSYSRKKIRLLHFQLIYFVLNNIKPFTWQCTSIFYIPMFGNNISAYNVSQSIFQNHEKLLIYVYKPVSGHN